MVSSMRVTHCSSMITRSGWVLVSRILGGIVDGGLSTTQLAGLRIVWFVWINFSSVHR